MAKTAPVVPVKFFIAILYRESQYLDNAYSEIEQNLDSIDFKSRSIHFDVTDYYEPEMGTPLYRTTCTLTTLRDPTILPGMKHTCNRIEDALGREGKRTVNLDCGYIDHHKIILASAKEAGQKIYLGEGIYADPAARYKHKTFEPFEWSFPDFKDNRYTDIFLEIRARYMKQKRLQQFAETSG